MLKNNAVENGIVTLLEKLDGHRNSIVLLSVASSIDKSLIKPILDGLLNYLEQGTLCVIGDCGFNTANSNIVYLESLSNKERKVLSSDYTLQLLGLNHDAHFAKHPSISLGCVGHYARYLTRHQHLDFPYGSLSVFADLAALNAIYINIGPVDNVYALRHAYTDIDPIITRNVCIYDNTLMAYLDFEVDEAVLKEALVDRVSLEFNGLSMSGARYQNILHDINEKLDA